MINVTHAITIQSDQFRFAFPVRSLGVVAHADTVIAYDGPVEVRTPYDDCVLVMPHLKPNKRAGETAVRLGRMSAD